MNLPNPTLKQAIERLRRVGTPDRDYSLFLVTHPEDYQLRGWKIVVYAIFDSSAGTATLYKLVLDKRDSVHFKENYSDDVEGWARFVREKVPDILRNATTSYLNKRNNGRMSWRIRGIIGWNFLTDAATQRRIYHLKSKHPKGK